MNTFIFSAISSMGYFLLLLLFGVIVYMVPFLLAEERRHPHAKYIYWFNISLGWTILGWVLALVWTFSMKRRVQRIPVWELWRLCKFTLKKDADAVREWRLVWNARVE